MHHKRNLKRILVASFILTMIGFVLDLGERDPNILINLKDIIVMTTLIFVISSMVYLIVRLLERSLVKYG